MQRKLILLMAVDHVDAVADIVSQVSGLYLDDYGELGPEPESFYDYDGPHTGMAIVMFDDEEWGGWEAAPENVITELQTEAGLPDGALRVHRFWVGLPDGLPREFYEQVWPMCQRLHDAEAKHDKREISICRELLEPIVTRAHVDAAESLTGWLLDMGAALGGIDLSSPRPARQPDQGKEESTNE